MPQSRKPISGKLAASNLAHAVYELREALEEVSRQAHGDPHLQKLLASTIAVQASYLRMLLTSYHGLQSGQPPVFDRTEAAE